MYKSYGYMASIWNQLNGKFKYAVKHPCWYFKFSEELKNIFLRDGYAIIKILSSGRYLKFCWTI